MWCHTGSTHGYCVLVRGLVPVSSSGSRPVVVGARVIGRDRKASRYRESDVVLRDPRDGRRRSVGSGTAMDLGRVRSGRPAHKSSPRVTHHRIRGCVGGKVPPRLPFVPSLRIIPFLFPPRTWFCHSVPQSPSLLAPSTVRPVSGETEVRAVIRKGVFFR